MKRYFIVVKSIPTEKTLKEYPETKTKYYLYGKNQHLINDIWHNESYDLEEPRLKNLIKFMAWESPKGCKISLKSHQRNAEWETNYGNYITTCEMKEVEFN